MVRSIQDLKDGQQTGWYVLIVCLIVYFFMVIIAA
jgi:nitrogen fixation protein FixH